MARSSLLVAALVALTLAAPSAAQTPAEDSVVGSGIATFVTPDLAGLTVPFAIDVRGGSSGENPVGSMQLFIAFTDPTCFVIRSGGGQVADEATINFRNSLTGSRVVARIGGGTSGPRQIGLYQASSASDCAFREPGSIAEVVEGDIRIIDAPALPTTKQQCKDGGWRSYPVFKNQGDCIRSVTPA